MTHIHLGPRASKAWQRKQAQRRPLAGQRHVRVAQDADAIIRKKSGAKEPSLPKLKFLEESSEPSQT